MEKILLSKALEANLSRTLDQVDEIPPKQKWFGALSSSTWGIHNRTKEFLIELNHKFRNDKHVLELLHSICLEDFWFYNSLEESTEALAVLIDVFEVLFGSVNDESNRELLITTLIKFMDRLSTQEAFPENIMLRCFSIIEADIPQNEVLYVRNSGYFKTCFDRLAHINTFGPIVMRLTANILDRCFDYWEETSHAEAWFDSRRHLFTVMDDAKKICDIGHSFFEQLRAERQHSQTWEELRHVMFYNDISNYFRSFTKEFTSGLETIHYLYYLLHLPGMSKLYDHLLYDINRNLRTVFKELEAESVPDFLDSIIWELQDLKVDHTRTVLDCIATLGKEIIASKNKSSISYFINCIIEFGFSYPGNPKLNDDWQIQVNTNHVKNIRVFLDLVEKAPSSMRELLNALIVELKLGGIYISDTDLFQRDVTKLLNSNIAPVYREIKQLTRIFPVFFQDIGAEGTLREVTTNIDGLSMRRDRLIHFLRVQIHVESNNKNVDLARQIIGYWYDGNKNPLREFLPDELYNTLDDDHEWYLGAHNALLLLCKDMKLELDELLAVNIEIIKSKVAALYPDLDTHMSKVVDIIHIHDLLLEKYSFETENVVALVEKTRFFSNEELAELGSALENGSDEYAIVLLYRLMNHLKSTILDPNQTEAFENIRYKRHIAAGIPSTYGQYKEPKFEALGMMYRLERVVSQLMACILESFSHQYLTVKTLRHIYDVLVLFKEGLALDGIYDQSFNSHLDMFKYSLASPSFSLRQYINIFQFLSQDVSHIIKGYFLNVYERPLAVIIPQVLSEQNVPSEEHTRERLQIEMEKFFRDILSSAFLVQELDVFIASTISILRNMIDNYSSSLIENMLTYDPDLTFSLLSQTEEELDNPIFIGAKAFFLKKLCFLGLPVPRGFIITTEAFRHMEPILRHPYLSQDFVKSIEQHIAMVEQETDRIFGSPNNPLFFSVRSGSFISLPGAMKTFLNVGMNDEITETWGRREKFAWTAWDCYRRFLQSWGMSFGIERDIFDQIITDHKDKLGVDLKIQFTNKQMRQIAYDYKDVLVSNNIHIDPSPMGQLRTAINSVMDSWSSESSVTFRDHMQIANEWGTAVLVQKMVLGNLSERSGSGVVFTSSPLKDYSNIDLYGDFAICSQGEDVVSGLVNTLPISESQRKTQYNDLISLESAFPLVYKTLHKYAKLLIEQHGFVHQEIEFTFDSDQPEGVYILQTRNQKVNRQKTYRSFASAPHEMQLVGHGIGVSGSVLSGCLAFDMQDMERIRTSLPDTRVILVRPDTVPDDIPMLFVCDGLITAKGGATSHAAVTAVGLGKVCIVRCDGLHVNDSEKSCSINGHVFRTGDPISIDGDTGSIFAGNYEIIET